MTNTHNEELDISLGFAHNYIQTTQQKGFFMKKLMIVAMTACYSVVAFALDLGKPQNDPMNAVVRIESVHTVPNFSLPWQNRMPQSSSGSGVVIKGKQILTNAHNISDSSLITV